MDKTFAEVCSIEESSKSFKSRPYLMSHVAVTPKTLPLKLTGLLDLKIKISVNGYR